MCAARYRLGKLGYKALEFFENAAALDGDIAAAPNPEKEIPARPLADILLGQGKAPIKPKIAPVLVKGAAAERDEDANRAMVRARKQQFDTHIKAKALSAASEGAPGKSWLDSPPAKDERSKYQAAEARAAASQKRVDAAAKFLLGHNDSEIDETPSCSRVAITDAGEVMLLPNWLDPMRATIIDPDMAARMVAMFRKLPADHPLSLPGEA
jgi:hypothetical protein